MNTDTIHSINKKYFENTTWSFIDNDGLLALSRREYGFDWMQYLPDEHCAIIDTNDNSLVACISDDEDVIEYIIMFSKLSKLKLDVERLKTFKGIPWHYNDLKNDLNKKIFGILTINSLELMFRFILDQVNHKLPFAADDCHRLLQLCEDSWSAREVVDKLLDSSIIGAIEEIVDNEFMPPSIRHAAILLSWYAPIKSRIEANAKSHRLNYLRNKIILSEEESEELTTLLTDTGDA